MNYEIVESFAQMVREKNIDKDVLASIVEDIFRLLMRKKYGEDANYDVIVNLDKGEIEIYLLREIVEKVENPNLQISLEEVIKKGGEGLEIGDFFPEEIRLEDFGRRYITYAKQILNQKLREIEKEIKYNEYSQLLNEIIIGDIYQNKKDEILVNHNKTELVMPRSEQIPNEKYKKGSTIRAIVKSIEKTPKGPRIIISRADDKFLMKLFENEIPEVYDGIVEIKAIARKPGERAKVAVYSTDERIDAVGACVGMKGVRIHSIVKELNNENIDIVNYSDNLEVFIRRALAPGKINKVVLDKKNKTAIVHADEDQASLIVGKEGLNIKLTEKLTGYKIDIHREEVLPEKYEVDIELIEFKQELGNDVYMKLIEAGFDGTTDVFRAGKERLLEIEGFTPEKVEEIWTLLKEGYNDNLDD